MERQRIMIVVLIAAIALGGVASYSIYNYLQSQQQEVERAKSELVLVRQGMLQAESERELLTPRSI